MYRLRLLSFLIFNVAKIKKARKFSINANRQNNACHCADGIDDAFFSQA